MSRTNNNETALPDTIQKFMPAETKGLTISDIRRRRAVVLLQKEYCKEKMQFNLLKLKNTSPFSKGYQGGKGKGKSKPVAILQKVVGGMNYLDYALIGFSIFGQVRKLFKFFRKK